MTLAWIIYFITYDVQGGRGLQATLNSHSKKFVGILNGIDTDAWNPATDPLVKVQYNSNDIEGKAENKEALRSHLGMSSANVWQPLVNMLNFWGLSYITYLSIIVCVYSINIISWYLFNCISAYAFCYMIDL